MSKKIVHFLFLIFLGITLLFSPFQATAALNGTICTGSVTPAMNGSILVKGDSLNGPVEERFVIRNSAFDVNLAEYFPPSIGGSTTIKEIEFFKDTDNTPQNSNNDTSTGIKVTFSLNEELGSGTSGNEYVCNKLQNVSVPVTQVTPQTQSFGCFYKDGWATGQVFPIRPDNDPKTPIATYPSREAADADCGTFVQIATGGTAHTCSPRSNMSDADVQNALATNKPVFHTLQTSGTEKSCMSCLGNVGQPICDNPDDVSTKGKYSIVNGSCIEDVNGTMTKNECSEALDKLRPTAVQPTFRPPHPPCVDEPDAKGKVTNCTGVMTGLGFVLNTGPQEFVGSLFTFFLSISGMILVGIIVYSGYQMMMSQGDPKRIQGARERITSAIIGFIFLIFSIVMLEIIGVNILRLPGFCGESNKAECDPIKTTEPTPFPVAPTSMPIPPAPGT